MAKKTTTTTTTRVSLTDKLIIVDFAICYMSPSPRNTPSRPWPWYTLRDLHEDYCKMLILINNNYLT